LEFREVLVVRTQPSRESPDPLDGVQLRAVGREEFQSQEGSILLQEGPEIAAMVVSGVIHNQDLATPARSVPHQMMEEGFKSHGVKGLRKLGHQLAPV